MHRLRRAVLVLAVLTPACAGITSAPKVAPKLTCTVEKGRPSFCASGGEHFVVGLNAAQGLDRGDWVLLELAVEGAEPKQTRGVAMAVVLEPYPDVAKVHVLYQVEPKLDGAGVRKIGKAENECLLDRNASPKFTEQWWTRGGPVHLLQTEVAEPPEPAEPPKSKNVFERD
jgi:hypothetical protein